MSTPKQDATSIYAVSVDVNSSPILLAVDKATEAIRYSTSVIPGDPINETFVPANNQMYYYTDAGFVTVDAATGLEFTDLYNRVYQHLRYLALDINNKIYQ